MKKAGLKLPNSAETQLDRLGLDSLERMDLALQIEDRYGFRSDRVAETLGELWALADGQLSSSDGKIEAPPPAWNVPPSSTDEPAILGDTIGEAFVRRVVKTPDDVSTADRISGVLSYRKLYVAARLMSKRFAALTPSLFTMRKVANGDFNLAGETAPQADRRAQVPGRNAEHIDCDTVGVLLPGSVAADIVFYGLHLAGKLPVLLNWTTGPANLSHAVKTLNVRYVITSKKLIDRLGIQIEGTEYVYVEDIRGKIGKLEAAVTMISTYVLPGRMIRRAPRPDVDAPAVVLFTSGSESTPKAVPLTHRNLLVNLRAALKVLQATHKDVLLGFLPPFHGFWSPWQH